MAKGDVLQITANAWGPSTSTIAFSSTPANGDILLFATVLNEGGPQTSMAGATEIGDTADSGGSTYVRVQLYARLAGGSEANSYEATTPAGEWFEMAAMRIEGPFSSLSEITVEPALSVQASPLAIPASAATISGSSRVVVAAAADSGRTMSFDGSFTGSDFDWLQLVHRTYSSGTAQTNATWDDSGDAFGSALMAVISLGSAAAVISTPTPSGTLGTQTTATLGATTNQTTGTLYGVVTTASLTGVTASQVKAGQNASGSTSGVSSGNSSVSTTTPSIGITGLTAGTAYNYAEVQNNANGDSNVVIGSFTTASASLTTSLTIVDAAGANVASTSLTWWLRQANAIVANGTTSTNGSGLLSLSVPTASAGAATLYYQNAGNTLSGERVVTVA